MKKVLLAEDHDIVVRGIKNIFETEFCGMSLNPVSNSVQLMQRLRQTPYDLLILDLQLEDGAVLHLVTDIVSLYPALKILVFSGNAEEIYAQKLYNQGVKGYLSKHTGSTEIINAIHEVLNGKVYMSETFKQLLLTKSPRSAGPDPLDQLTSRELEVANLLQLGKRASEICLALNVQPSTIATYKKKVFEKLNISNIIELKEVFQHKG